MIKKLQLFSIALVFPLFINAQTQIGSDIYGEAAGDKSGTSVSLSDDGTVIAIGAPENGLDQLGHVRVYKNNAGTWSLIGFEIDGEVTVRYNHSGYSVSLSGDGNIVAIGANGNDETGTDSGHVRVYKNESGVWTKIGADIDGEATNDYSGGSVSLSNDGSVVAIGALGNDGNGDLSGHVRVYKNMSGVWTKIGSDLDGEALGDQSGYSVSLSDDGNIVAIGALYNDGISGADSGHVRVYQNMSGVWTKIGADIDGEATIDYSGRSVSLSSDGSIIAIGASGNDGNGDSSGQVRVYKNESGVWTKIGADINGEAAGDLSGTSVSLSNDGNIVAIGATNNGGVGHVRVYKNESGVWTQTSTDIDGKVAGERFGSAVSLSGDGSIVAIGAPRNDGISNAFTDTGDVRVYNLVPDLGFDKFELSQFSIYPNPVREQFTIQLDENLILESVTIYTSLGQPVINSNDKIINTTGLSSGLYFVEITTNKGKVTKKIIVQ